jgi:Type IIA topoisomerase (DNA gyrase/topo II, topoisomerase IV), B subunit
MGKEKLLSEEYKAEDIKAVTGLEHVRIRPSMYIGDVGERGFTPPHLGDPGQRSG